MLRDLDSGGECAAMRLADYPHCPGKRFQSLSSLILSLDSARACTVLFAHSICRNWRRKKSLERALIIGSLGTNYSRETVIKAYKAKYFICSYVYRYKCSHIQILTSNYISS